MKSKLRPLGAKFDGKSRVSNDLYRKNWNKIFKKNLEGTVINIGESFSSDDFLDQAEREKKELEESYQESLRQTKERKEKDGS
jgi:predicted patatin/cPLA2 family phospholipase